MIHVQDCFKRSPIMKTKFYPVKIFVLTGFFTKIKADTMWKQNVELHHSNPLQQQLPSDNQKIMKHTKQRIYSHNRS